jgi:hypothetical protein
LSNNFKKKSNIWPIYEKKFFRPIFALSYSVTVLLPVLGANLRGHITRTPETTEMALVTEDASNSEVTEKLKKKNC